MKIKYVGPHKAITVEVDKTVLEVERGEAFDVPDDEGKRLIEQDIWEQVGKPAARPRKAAKKAARKPVAEAPEETEGDSEQASADADENKED